MPPHKVPTLAASGFSESTRRTFSPAIQRSNLRLTVIDDLMKFSVNLETTRDQLLQTHDSPPEDSVSDATVCESDSLERPTKPGLDPERCRKRNRIAEGLGASPGFVRASKSSSRLLRI